MRSKANLILLLVSIIWGISFVAQDIAGQYHLAYLFNGVSFVLAGLILLPFIPRQMPSRQQWKWMFLAGLILSIASALQQLGLYFTQVANASFLTSLYVVFIPFFLWLGFREQPHRLDLIAVLLAGLGAFLLSTAGTFTFQSGDLIELLGAVFWALHLILLGKFASKFNTLSFAAGQFLIGGSINLIIGLFLEDVSTLAILPVLVAVLYRAIFAVGIGYTVQVWGQRHTPPTVAALILGLEAAFAAIAAWLILGQSLGWIKIVGCVIIFSGAIISQLKEWNSGHLGHDQLVEGH